MTMSDCSLCNVMGCVGTVYTLYCLINAFSFIRINWFAKLNIKRKYARAGDWAVVTGASDGIGLAMATDLARRGMNVVLISRTKSKLHAAADAIKAKYTTIETKTIVFDFSDATPHSYKKLFNELEGLKIAVLVNNVGINYTNPQKFESIDIETDVSILKVNCETQMRLTKFVLPHMKASKAGAIVNLSSFSALFPVPLLATYAATKSFNGAFAECIEAEVASSGIDVLRVTPNFVSSNMTAGASDRKPRTSFMMVDPDEMARATLNKLGATNHTHGHPHHALIYTGLSFLPTFVTRKIIGDSQFAAFKKAEKKRAAAAKL